jgi:hypothetical protein
MASECAADLPVPMMPIFALLRGTESRRQRDGAYDGTRLGAARDEETEVVCMAFPRILT